MPLSVLEAMACNIPVISRKFAGLHKFFNEGDGLLFAETDKEIIDKVNQTISSKNSLKIKTRDKVSLCSWENIAKSLNRIYTALLIGGQNYNEN